MRIADRVPLLKFFTHDRADGCDKDARTRNADDNRRSESAAADVQRIRDSGTHNRTDDADQAVCPKTVFAFHKNSGKPSDERADYNCKNNYHYHNNTSRSV